MNDINENAITNPIYQQAFQDGNNIKLHVPHKRNN